MREVRGNCFLNSQYMQCHFSISQVLFVVYYRADMFDHMTHDHGFSVGLPDNLGEDFIL